MPPSEANFSHNEDEKQHRVSKHTLTTRTMTMTASAVAHANGFKPTGYSQLELPRS